MYFQCLSIIGLLVFSINAYAVDSWKILSRVADQNQESIEIIPSDQTEENWSEHIYMGFYDKSVIEGDELDVLELSNKSLAREIQQKYPQNRFTLNIIEKNSRELLFEAFMSKQTGPRVYYGKIQPSHQITRAIQTENGFSLITYVKKNKKLSSSDRERWIGLLRKIDSIGSFKEYFLK